MADLNWAFTLSDEMTKPLDHIEKALESLPNDLEAVERAMVSLEKQSEMRKLSKMTDTVKAQQAILRIHHKELTAKAALESKAFAAAEKAAQKEAQIAQKAQDTQQKLAEQSAQKAAAMQQKRSMAEAMSLRSAQRSQQTQIAHHQKMQQKIWHEQGKAAAHAHKIQSDLRRKELAGGVALGNLLSMLAQKALQFGVSILRGAKSLAEFALEAAAGKRAAVAMIATFEGADAGRVEEILGEMAKAAGVTGDKTAEMFVKLRGAGLEAQEAQNTIAAALDVRAMQGGGEKGMAAADKFLDMIAKIGVLAKASPKDLKMLAVDVGINPEKIAEQMAKRTGGTAKAALALLDSGKADAMAIQTALLDVIQQRGGGGAFGSLAKSFQAGDVSGQVTSLKEELSGLVDDIDFSPLAKGLAEVRKFFAGDAGARIKDAFAGLGPLLTIAGEKALVVFNAFSKAFDGAMLKDMSGVLAKFVGMLGLLDTKTLEGVGQAFALIAKFLGAATFVAISFFAVMFKSITNTVVVINSMFSALLELPGKMIDLGKAMIDGLLGGIDAGLSKLGDAAGKLAGTFIGTIKDKFQIRSPSRVMMGLGEQIGAGFSMGVESSMPDIGALPALGEGGSVSGRGGIVINLGGIVVNGTSDAASREAASRVESDIKGALMSALEGFALA